MSARAALVAHCPPEPPWSGERRRVAATLRYLDARFGCDLVLCPPAEGAAAQLRRKLAAPLAPPTARIVRPPAVALERYELVWVFELWAMSAVPARLRPSVVWDKDSLLYELYERDTAAGRLKAAWSRRWELHWLRRAAIGLLASADDVRRLGIERVHHLPNGFEPPAALPERAPREERLVLGFVGDLGFVPNQRGLQVLLDEVLPELGDSARVLVAGRADGLPAALRARLDAHPAVTVLGYVERLEDLYARLDVLLATMPEGIGTPTKVIEALGHGVPVAGTAVSGRDLPAGLQPYYRVAGPGGWAEAVAAAAALGAEPARLRAAVEDASWERRFAAALDPLLEPLLRSRSR
ncbi:MAG TPA: glycosyltransferase [Solirubrobacteraceae bacterium]|nr:glycosyltransferase [Solirubrobacteraceae bacterium]